MSDGKVILSIRNLKKYFSVKASFFSSQNLILKAVNHIDLDVYRGETLGIVGESGCGKTTVGRCITRLYEPDEGRIWLNPNEQVVKDVSALDDEIRELGDEADKNNRARAARVRKIQALKKQADELARENDILCMNRKRLKASRRQIQLIFQDPWASLNPHMMVKDIIGEGPKEFDVYRGESLKAWVHELLERVGLPSAAANRYPHEFSGGQRQRICIARALALTPSIVICDEPVSALDVSIQAQVLNLLASLQEEFELTYIFIAHDLSVVEYVSDRIAVMYLGKIVEMAEAQQLYQNPRHPYTQSLLSSVPIADPTVKNEQIILEGDVPSPINPPSGCSFHPRCPYRSEKCTEIIPLLEKDRGGHRIACHNPPNDPPARHSAHDLSC